MEEKLDLDDADSSSYAVLAVCWVCGRQGARAKVVGKIESIWLV